MDRIQIVVLILVVSGSLIPAMCMIKMRMIRRFKQNAVITPAIITHSEKRIGMKGSVYYILFIKYNDESGRSFTGSALGSKKNIPGTTVPVMYNINDPTKYKTDFGKYLPWLLGFSIIFLVAIIWFCYWLLHSGYTVDPLIIEK